MTDNAHSQPHTSHLSANQRNLLASKLMTQHDEIMQQLNALDQQTRTPDGDDAVQRGGSHEVDAKLSEIEQRQFDGINQALLRVSGQSYGICVSCGAEIAFARLQAEPPAARCLECQAGRERTLEI